MNKFGKRFVWSCAVMLFVLLLSTNAHAAETSAAPNYDVRVQINDGLVDFPDAKPFIDASNVLQVPLRPVTELLGYEVEWKMEGSDVEMTVTNEEQKVVLRTGEETAAVGDQNVELASPPVVLEGRTYAPLNVLRSAFGVDIDWDAENGVAIVNADGGTHTSKYVAPPKVTAALEQPTLTDKIIDTAYNYLGVPYVWGGTTPNGFDCSGFVQFVFRQNGINLPRTQGQMFATLGTLLPAPQRGDLVFFAEGGSTSHVGIYIGDGKYINAASSGASKGISVAQMSNSWSMKHYVGAKRVIPQ